MIMAKSCRIDQIIWYEASESLPDDGETVFIFGPEFDCISTGEIRDGLWDITCNLINTMFYSTGFRDVPVACPEVTMWAHTPKFKAKEPK